MFRFAFTIFVSAFLLFQVQPLIAKLILPWFGGSSVVWTTCMMFFQILLVAGYAYAHLAHRLLSPKAQWLLQSAVILVACFFLPIRADETWKPTSFDDPSWEILKLLGFSIGLPFFVLTTTSPLLQAWVAKTLPTRSPYRLYALSNVGSLLALLSYPFLIEPNLSLPVQSLIWTAAFIAFAIATFWSGYRYQVAENSRNHNIIGQEVKSHDHDRSASGEVAVQEHKSSRIELTPLLLWTLLPMAASIMLIACTNMMTHEVASVPFLWIVPLSLYLLTFVICFDHPRWYVRPIVWLLLWFAVILGVFLMESGVESDLGLQIFGYSAISFLTAFACHGELARIKLAVDRLTLFYLMMGVGGALGGIFVAIVAPRIFDDFMEFYLGLFMTVILIYLAYLHQITNFAKSDSSVSASSVRNTKATVNNRPNYWSLLRFIGYTLGCTVITAMIIAGANHYRLGLSGKEDDEHIVFKARNAYGVLTVKDVDGGLERLAYRVLINGRIDHGHQFIGSHLEHAPVSYYGNNSGIGRAMRYLREQDIGAGLNIGVIGLGVGITSAYATTGDQVYFYEINPLVKFVAENKFTYLSDLYTKIGENRKFRLGDARIQLERDLATSNIKFDVLVVDAFTSDAIPAHLLTQECFELYRKCLVENGVLLVHISNRYLDLEPVVMNISRELQWQASIIDATEPTSCSWVVLSDDTLLHLDDVIFEARTEYEERLPNLIWTDNYTSIFPIVDWSRFEFMDLFQSPIWKRPRKDED